MCRELRGFGGLRPIGSARRRHGAIAQSAVGFILEGRAYALRPLFRAVVFWILPDSSHCRTAATAPSASDFLTSAGWLANRQGSSGKAYRASERPAFPLGVRAKALLWVGGGGPRAQTGRGAAGRKRRVELNCFSLFLFQVSTRRVAVGREHGEHGQEVMEVGTVPASLAPAAVSVSKASARRSEGRQPASQGRPLGDRLPTSRAEALLLLRHALATGRPGRWTD